MIPSDYRSKWAPEVAPTIEAQIADLARWRDASAEMVLAQPHFDPRSLEEVTFEMHLRVLATSFMAASAANEVGRAEIMVCALTNVLGSIVMAGCRDIPDMSQRIDKIGRRLGNFATEEMEKHRADRG